MENDYQEKRKYTGKSKYGSYTFEYTDLTGKRHEGFTSESQEKYIKRISLKKIKNKFSNITIKYKGNEYSSDKLNKMYNELAETEEEEINGLLLNSLLKVIAVSSVDHSPPIKDSVPETWKAKSQAIVSGKIRGPSVTVKETVVSKGHP